MTAEQEGVQDGRIEPHGDTGGGTGGRTPLAPLMRKLSGFAPLGPAERAALTAAFGAPRSYDARTELLREGEAGERGYVVNQGWAYCYKTLPDGRRQVVNFQLPGDSIGLRSLLLRTSDHSFGTLTPCAVSPIDLADWRRLVESQPRLAMAVLWLAAREEAMIVEHLVNVGRRSADMRTAHLLCEIGFRMTQQGAQTGNRFSAPLTQALMADALGLSVVHMNRSFRKLREAGLARMAARQVEVLDFSGLQAFCGFDGTYITVR